MKRVKNEESLLKWAEDSMEFIFKIAAALSVIFSVIMMIKGIIIFYKCDYMSFFEIYFMSNAEYDMEIFRNNTLFIENYDGYKCILMALKLLYFSLIMLIMSRVWGATTRIKHLYRTFYGKDLEFKF